ncbi:MAG: GAF domain-containing protein, partial [Planctomycetota bacterium]
VVLAAAVRGRLRAASVGASVPLRESELGMLGSVGAIAFIAHIDGSLDGATYPLMFVGFVLTSVIARSSATAVTIGFAMALEAAIRFVAFKEENGWPLVMHGLYAAVFAVLGLLVLRAEVARIRSHSRSRVEAEIERMHSAARSYRLLGATTRAADMHAGTEGQRDEDDPGRLVRSSVEEIHQAVLFALDLLRRSLGLHSAMLLWLNDSGTHLRISELATDSERVAEGPFPVNDGVFGAVAAEGSLVVLSGLKPSYGVPFYTGPCPIKALAAVPVLESDHLRGVLVADRTEDIPFSDSEQELLMAATRYVLRAIHNERVFVQLERAKVEQGKLYRAAGARAAARWARAGGGAGVGGA